MPGSTPEHKRKHTWVVCKEETHPCQENAPSASATISLTHFTVVEIEHLEVICKSWRIETFTYIGSRSAKTFRLRFLDCCFSL